MKLTVYLYASLNPYLFSVNLKLTVQKFFIHWFNYFLVMLNMRNIRNFWLRIMTDEHENSFGLHLGTRKLIRKSIKVSLVIKLKIPLAQ